MTNTILFILAVPLTTILIDLAIFVLKETPKYKGCKAELLGEVLSYIIFTNLFAAIIIYLVLLLIKLYPLVYT